MLFVFVPFVPVPCASMRLMVKMGNGGTYRSGKSIREVVVANAAYAYDVSHRRRLE